MTSYDISGSPFRKTAVMVLFKAFPTHMQKIYGIDIFRIKDIYENVHFYV